MIKIGDRVKVTRGLFIGIKGTVYSIEGKLVLIDKDNANVSYAVPENFCKLIEQK
ncbi:MAG: hypothetical protein II604_00315 [Bacteroidales bacterium]|nr:hypothetical protein [Bacteroidales bacterium]